MSGLFEGSKLKVKRANQHIGELNRLLADFIDSGCCTVVIEKQSNTGNSIAQVKGAKPMPLEIPLIIGDAIHNLRTALDLMACEIVTIAGKTPNRHTKFPFRDTREEVIDAVDKGQIKIAGADIVALIVDDVKPYKGGNDALCGLHSLDVTDKHRLLIPIISLTGLVHVNARIGAMVLVDCEIRIESNGVLNLTEFPSDSEIQYEGEPVFEILFGNRQSFELRPVVPTLKQLSELVSGVIDTFQKAYLAKRS